MAFPPKPNMSHFGPATQAKPADPQGDDAKKHKGVPPKPTNHGTPPPGPMPHKIGK